MTQEKRAIPPLDAAGLERLALRYVERFQTTRGKLADYLHRKIRERGWDGHAADVPALAQRLADLGYVDDLAFAEAKAAALGRRGLGARRVTMALRQARVGEADAEEVASGIAERAVEAALTFARRKRVGAFGTTLPDRASRDKQIATMLRAGHSFALSRRIVEASEPPAADDLNQD